MQTKNIVEASANIITITSLKPGDVYKRLDKSYSGYSVHFGVVTSTLNNGTDAAIFAIEWKGNYREIESVAKIFGTDDDIKIFPADPEEIREHLDEVKRSGESAIQKAQQDEAKAREALARATEAYEIASRGGLTAPSVTTPNA